jgi:predicted glycosyltransferase
MRPPARSALYHRFDNPLFDAAFAHVRSDPHTVVLLVERLSLQPPVDGPNLVYWSDLVIGAGGTMTREAAILGTPAYTVYGGRPIAVDNYLIEQGRLERLESTADLARIKLEKKRAARSMARPAALQQVVATIRAVGDPSG